MSKNWLIFQVILEVNRTEVSHSGEAVGIEVFAEPDSIICLRGYAKESGAVSPYYSSSNDGDAVAGRRKIRVFGSGLSTRKTWFFRCGNARLVIKPAFSQFRDMHLSLESKQTNTWVHFICVTYWTGNKTRFCC